ncbi:MAG: hypothetical protein EOO77_21195 [Oxalobacteraceae bacterium]|nr:MAG: hypothetical protein EOO77_21195 [Oxalobacteraceae bacterium]
MKSLHDSVGLGGNNRESDVLLVQTALRDHGVSPGPLDRICGRKTITAIEHFQSGFLNRIDGRIDPHGPTWRRLNRSVTPVGSPHPNIRGATNPSSAGIPSHTQASVPPRPASGSPAVQVGNATAYWRQDTPLPPSGTINRGVLSPSSSEQVARFGGMPSSHMSQKDSPITNPVLLGMIATESVGPFRATGLKVALASLRSIFAEVRRDLPDLYPLIGSAGMNVNRLQRGSTTKVSNHAWGSAIDLTIAGKLVPFGRAGWYWGGGYRRARADAMHFECGSAMLRIPR